MTKKAKFKIFHARKSFKKEFKRQLRFAIIAAIGFTIAFAWRNALYNSFNIVVKKFLKTADIVLSEFFTAILITLTGVILLLITSKLLKEKN